MPTERPRRPVPEPLRTDDVAVVTLGTALFALAFLALLPFAGRLAETGRAGWLWTCAAGVGLGLIGIRTTRRNRERR